MNLTAGLYLYEVVLLVLGVILFLVLVFAFLYMVLKGKKVVSLLAFFLLPIAMIGYPSIQSLKYEEGVLTLEKRTQQLLENPQDSTTRQEIHETVSKLSKRPADDPKSATVLAKAQFAIGDEAGASQTLQKVHEMAPGYPEAAKLQNKIQLVHRLEQLASKVDQNPSDQQARAALQETVSVARQTPISNPSALVHLAHAESALGDNQNALKTIDKAEQIAPQLAETREFRRTIENRVAAEPAR